LSAKQREKKQFAKGTISRGTVCQWNSFPKEQFSRGTVCQRNSLPKKHFGKTTVLPILSAERVYDREKKLLFVKFSK
jgi:hypothetical protein